MYRQAIFEFRVCNNFKKLFFVRECADSFLIFLIKSIAKEWFEINFVHHIKLSFKHPNRY